MWDMHIASLPFYHLAMKDGIKECISRDKEMRASHDQRKESIPSIRRNRKRVLMSRTPHFGEEEQDY